VGVTVFKAMTESAVNQLNGGVNGGVNTLLAYIQAKPGKRASESAESLNIPLRSTERWLKQLKETGKIEFRGATKTGGYFALDADQ
jgi:ATP-dependent DNA helicase RecG